MLIMSRRCYLSSEGWNGPTVVIGLPVAWCRLWNEAAQSAARRFAESQSAAFKPVRRVP
jgi:hypothetical protein